ncbi:MAG: tetratricopeptide repeat protein [Proteobacteria bacterium]|nr:tetratricopeptide repeat protein [Pseudomonadota bacterium]
MTNTCKQFDSFLIDLAYGELSDSHAEELKTHAAQCSTCRKALDEIMLVRKMAQQLPPLEPASSMDALVFNAAADGADQYSKQESSRSVPETADPDLPIAPIDSGPSFCERLRAFFLSPALATAAVVALVFVISFFLVQKGPLQEKQVHKEGPAIFEAPIAESDRLVLQDEDKSKKSAIPKDGESLEKESARIKPGASKSKRQPALPTQPAPRSAPQRRKGVPAESERRSARGSGYATDYLGSAEAVSDGYPSAQTAAAPTKKSLPEPATSDFHMGKEAYARGDCKTAITAFLRIVGQPSTPPSQAAFAMHHIGTCEKRQDRCVKAVEWYEKLLKRYSRYKYKAAALWEAASCYRRLGQVNRARALLDQLAPIPGWETKVKQELERLDK